MSKGGIFEALSDKMMGWSAWTVIEAEEKACYSASISIIMFTLNLYSAFGIEL